MTVVILVNVITLLITLRVADGKGFGVGLRRELSADRQAAAIRKIGSKVYILM